MQAMINLRWQLRSRGRLDAAPPPPPPPPLLTGFQIQTEITSPAPGELQENLGEEVAPGPVRRCRWNVFIRGTFEVLEVTVTKYYLSKVDALMNVVNMSSKQALNLLST